MTVTRPAAADRKILFNPDGKSMMFGAIEKGIVYNNVADTQDYISIVFPYYGGYTARSGISLSVFYGINFGGHSGNAINFEQANDDFFPWWNGTEMENWGDKFDHLYRQWRDVHALDRGMFQPQTGGFPRLRYDAFADAGAHVRLPINRYVGYGYGDIYCSVVWLWWYNKDPTNEDDPDYPFDTSDPNLIGTATAWRSTSTSSAPPVGAITKSVSMPWLPLIDYQSTVPSGGGFVVSWDNEEDEISIT